MFLNRNLTSYPTILTAKIEQIKNDYEKIKTDLKLHQYIVRRYFSDPDFNLGKPGQSRGLLLYHGTGTGKTIAAIGILLALIDIKDPVLLIKNSLQENFRKDIRKILKDDKEMLENVLGRLNFITADAYNAGTQLKMKMGTLNGKLLIVDEAHHLFKSIINSKDDNTNARIIFNMIMSAYDIRIIFLSGTPLDKDPFELVPAINMLTGTNTLPESYELFNSLFISDEGKLMNKNKLQNRLFGLISFVSIENMKSSNMNFPKDLGIKIIDVKMSKEQYYNYVKIRENEENLKRKKIKNKKVRDLSPLSTKSDQSGSYYVASRQASIINLPIERSDKFITDAPDDYFNITNIPKVIKMVDNIIQSNTFPVIIYSEFINVGLNVIKRVLRNHGFNQFDPSKMLKPNKTYAEISGTIKQSDRNKVVENFNRPDNKYGDYIQILLISETGAEGLDLKNVRGVHILEPYWDWARINQIKARGIRNQSHIELPPEHQTVKTFIYNSIPPDDVDQFKEKTTIDKRLLLNAKNKNILLDEFNNALKEICIECSAMEYGNCRVCVPNNVKLYGKQISNDIESNDPCIKVENTKTKATKVLYDDIDYYYKFNDKHPLKYELYTYNKKLDGYQMMSISNPLYLNIINEIKK